MLRPLQAPFGTGNLARATATSSSSTFDDSGNVIGAGYPDPGALIGGSHSQRQRNSNADKCNTKKSAVYIGLLDGGGDADDLTQFAKDYTSILTNQENTPTIIMFWDWDNFTDRFGQKLGEAQVNDYLTRGDIHIVGHSTAGGTGSFQDILRAFGVWTDLSVKDNKPTGSNDRPVAHKKETEKDFENFANYVSPAAKRLAERIRAAHKRKKKTCEPLIYLHNCKSWWVVAYVFKTILPDASVYGWKSNIYLQGFTMGEDGKAQFFKPPYPMEERGKAPKFNFDKHEIIDWIKKLILINSKRELFLK